MEFTTHTVFSKDGTKIGFRRIGAGPALVVCHGGGRISQNYEQLANELSDRFTVIIPDRRGRGLSGPEGNDYGIEQAREDLLAVLEQTKADFVFGHSAGGLIALETARSYPFRKIAVYEPAISVNGSMPVDWFPAFETAISKGKMKRAIAILIKGLKLADGLSEMPLWAVQAFVNVLSVVASGKNKEEGMIALVPTISADMKMAIQMESQLDRYQNLQMPVLLMSGEKSADFFLKGLEELKTVLPEPELKIFKGLDHSAPEEKTENLVLSLKQFFAVN